MAVQDDDKDVPTPTETQLENARTRHVNKDGLSDTERVWLTRYGVHEDTHASHSAHYLRG